MLAFLLYSAGAFSLLYSILYFLSFSTHKADEPPILANTLPFVSSLWGLVTKGMDYFTCLRDNYPNAPIYTLRFPLFRVYVVNSPTLVQAIHKPSSQTVSWGPILGDIAANMMGLGQPTVRMLKDDLGPDGSFMKGFHKAMHVALDPKTVGLDKLSERAVLSYYASLTNDNIHSPVTVKLFEFLKRHGTVAVTDAVFGPHTPFRDPKMEGFYNQMETDLFSILLGIAPYTSAKAGLHAREFLVGEYTKYYSSGGHLDPASSELLRSRYAFYQSYGIPTHEIPRIETTLTATLLGNTRPTTFWLVWHLVSDAGLLETCRRELRSAMTPPPTEPGELTLNAASIKTKCPTLLATLHEVFRFHGNNMSTRKVVQDHTVTDTSNAGSKTYLLRAGSYIIAPASVHHSGAQDWGSSAGEFNPARFLNGASAYSRSAFRPWGHGGNVCPGRHFATCAVLGFAANIILRLEVTPAAGNGTGAGVREGGGKGGGRKWALPRTRQTPIIGSTVPCEDVVVDIASKDSVGGKWRMVYEPVAIEA